MILGRNAGNITFISKRESSPSSLCKQYSQERKSGKNTRKMGKEEIENFSLRVFIFFLKGNLYIHK